MAADDPILHSLGRADIALHHWAGVNPDALFHLWQIFLSVLFINGVRGQLHRHGASYRPLRIILLPDGGPKENEDRIANDLINCTPDTA